MAVCDLPLMNHVCGAVDDVVGKTGEAVTSGIGAWIAKSMGDLAQSAAGLAAKAVDKTTTVDLNAAWFRHNYELILPIGLVLTVGTFCLQLTRAAWRRDERAVAQAAIGTMIGVLFAFAAIGFTTVALTVSDALSAGLFKAAGSSLSDAVRRVIEVNELGAMFGLGWAVAAIMALGCAVGALLFWAVMLARKVGILVMVTLAVFAGAGGGWDMAKRWRQGWIEATATLVVSKLLMTIVFLLGVSAMGKSDSHGGLGALSDAMTGLVVMVLVLLCPYATYKFVHWAADGGGGHDGLHRTGVAGVATAAGAAKTAGQLAIQAKTGGIAPQGPSKVPGQGAGGVAAGIDPTGGSSGSGSSGSSAGDGDGKPDQPGSQAGEQPTGGPGEAGPAPSTTDSESGGPSNPPPGENPEAGQETPPVPPGPTPEGTTTNSTPGETSPATPPTDGPSPQGGDTPQQLAPPTPPDRPAA